MQLYRRTLTYLFKTWKDEEREIFSARVQDGISACSVARNASPNRPLHGSRARHRRRILMLFVLDVIRNTSVWPYQSTNLDCTCPKHSRENHCIPKLYQDSPAAYYGASCSILGWCTWDLLSKPFQNGRKLDLAISEYPPSFVNLSVLLHFPYPAAAP